MQKIKKLFLKYNELISYLFFGALTTLISLLVKYLLLFTILHASNPLQLQMAVVISWIIACLFAYITNRIYVFKSKSKQMLKEILSFFTSRIITLGMEMLIMFIFVTLLGLNNNTWVVIWTIVSQIVVIISNYVFSKFVVFKNKEEKK